MVEEEEVEEEVVEVEVEVGDTLPPFPGLFLAGLLSMGVTSRSLSEFSAVWISRTTSAWLGGAGSG